ncbi:C40 family peptidase [Streptomyces sp. AB3(2024)]|uniref:C40 family peptidase n=1 Tax=Streptomyces sp. AB3(2024) TaxID=3317321 RepID=UPI0035A35AC5
MDKKTLIVIVLVCAFLFSGGGLFLAGSGAIVAMAGVFNGSLGGSKGGGSSGGVPPGTVCDPGGETLKEHIPGYGWHTVDKQQMANAAVIVHVGEATKIPENGLIIAIMTALQESKLENIRGGDRDSVGLFQQRPSAGWGSIDEIMDPNYSAKAFFGGPNHPAPPNPPGLLAYKWETMGKGQAAQKVQASAFPEAYDKWESLAGKIVGRAKDIKCTDVGLEGDVGKVIAAAKRWIGTPYCWAGGDEKGPTNEERCPPPMPPGFDCSGLMHHAYAQVGISLYPYTGNQWEAGTRVHNYTDLKPGDLMFWSSDGTVPGIHHVSMYLGNDSMIHAPRTGKNVEIVTEVSKNSYWMNQWIGGSRILKEGSGSGKDSGGTQAAGIPLIGPRREI